MKNYKFNPGILLCLFILVLNGCKKGDMGPQGPAGTNGPTGSTGPVLTGTLAGHIMLSDQYGTSVFTGLNNISVSLDDTGSSSSTTDNNGMYSMSNISTGTYSLTVNKDASYGMMKVQNLQFVGGGTLNRDVRLSQIPTFSILTATAIDTTTATGNQIKLSGTVPTDTKARKAVVFVGSLPGVTSNTANYISTYTINIAANATVFNLLIPTTDFYNMGISSGGTAYLAVYPAAQMYNTTSTYEDFATGRTVFSAIGTNASSVSVLLQ